MANRQNRQITNYHTYLNLERLLGPGKIRSKYRITFHGTLIVRIRPEQYVGWLDFEIGRKSRRDPGAVIILVVEPLKKKRNDNAKILEVFLILRNNRNVFDFRMLLQICPLKTTFNRKLHWSFFFLLHIKCR